MKIDIPVHTLIIKEKGSGKEFSVKTTRSAEEMAGYIGESERELLIDAIEVAVSKLISENR